MVFKAELAEFVKSKVKLTTIGVGAGFLQLSTRAVPAIATPHIAQDDLIKSLLSIKFYWVMSITDRCKK